MFGRIREYAGDQKGAVAALFAIGLIGLVAAGALAWDISRAYALRAELDSAVDAAALAGATQLDGKDGARARAISAAQGAFVQNAQRLGNTAENNVVIAGTDITFLQNLTTRDAATSDANANLIQIDLAPRSLGVVMGAVLGATNFNARAHAVAGSETALCLSPPILVCNPEETSTNLDFDPEDYIGRVLQLTPASNTQAHTSWPAGNFGFIDVGNNTNLKEAMAGLNDNIQCYGESVVTQPGQIASADHYFNTRFDIYEKSAPSGNNNATYPAAMNTMIGTATKTNAACSPSIINPPNSCANSTAQNPYGFPIDCDQSGSVGSGVWNVAKYFNSNHPGVSYASPAGGIPSQPLYAGTGWNAYGPAPASGGTVPTRYQVYNWELAMLRGASAADGIAMAANAFGGPGNPKAVNSGTQDFARPVCNTASTQQTPDKRLITALVANCVDDGIKGRSTAYPITDVSLFLVAPSPTSGSGSGNIYGEVVGGAPVYGVGEDRVGATRRYWIRLYE